MKSVHAHLYKLSSLSFVVTAVLSSGTDGRASKPNVTTSSAPSFARVADCSKYAKNLRNAEPEAAMFTCCADRVFTFLEVKFYKELDTRDLNIACSNSRPQETAVEEFVAELSSRYR